MAGDLYGRRTAIFQAALLFDLLVSPATGSVPTETVNRAGRCDGSAIATRFSVLGARS